MSDQEGIKLSERIRKNIKQTQRELFERNKTGRYHCYRHGFNECPAEMLDCRKFVNTNV